MCTKVTGGKATGTKWVVQNWPQQIDSDRYKRALWETVGVHPVPTAEDHQRRTYAMPWDLGWWLSLFLFPVLTYLCLSSLFPLCFLPSFFCFFTLFLLDPYYLIIVNKVVSLAGCRYCASVVFYPNSRIAKLLYYPSGFRREYFICKQVEHPMVFCGWTPRGADGIWVYRRAPQSGPKAFLCYRQDLRGADGIF